jgi:hypothetical protein
MRTLTLAALLALAALLSACGGGDADDADCSLMTPAGDVRVAPVPCRDAAL